MEPMSLGSPIGSPTSSNPAGYAGPGGTQSGSHYLPGFLMGDVSSQVHII